MDESTSGPAAKDHTAHRSLADGYAAGINRRSITIHFPARSVPRTVSRHTARPALSLPTRDAVPTGGPVSKSSRISMRRIASSNMSSPVLGPTWVQYHIDRLHLVRAAWAPSGWGRKRRTSTHRRADVREGPARAPRERRNHATPHSTVCHDSGGVGPECDRNSGNLFDLAPSGPIDMRTAHRACPQPARLTASPASARDLNYILLIRM